MWRIKNVKKKHSSAENCPGGSRQERYMGGWIKGTTKNTGAGWRKIGDDGKARNPQEER